MKKCEFCGKEINEEQEVCPFCGIAVPEDNAEEKENNKGLVIAIIIMLVLLVAGIITGVVIIKDKLSENEEKQQTAYGKKYYAEEKFEKAAEAYEKALEIKPDAENYLSLSRCYLGMGDKNKAVKKLEEGYEKTGAQELKKQEKIIKGVDEAYMKLASELAAKYGSPRAVETEGKNQGYCLTGVTTVRKYDFDGDQIDEFICAWGETDKKNEYKNTVQVYSFDGNKTELIYSGISPEEEINIKADKELITRDRYYLEYTKRQGHRYLLTKKSKDEPLYEEWSELKSGKFSVEKTLDGRKGKSEEFKKESGELEKSAQKVIFSGCSKSDIKKSLDRARKELLQFGYAVPSADWKSLYKETIEKAVEEDKDKNMDGFDLFDVDGDGIPELFISEGMNYENECRIYSIIDNDIARLPLSSCYGQIYANGDKHYFMDKALHNGTDRMIVSQKTGDEVKEMFTASNDEGAGYGDDGGADYYVNDKKVSKEDYEKETKKYLEIEWLKLGKRYEFDLKTAREMIDIWNGNVIYSTRRKTTT